VNMKADPILRDKLDGRISGLESERTSWLAHWRELADFILPRRYRWLLSANQSRGGQINNNIIDSTGTIAARTCASGMLAGVTSPTRPWFKLQLDGFTNADDNGPVSIWLAICEARMRRVFSESNFYNAIGVLYSDLVVFGSGSLLLYEDYHDVIRCYNPCAGEYFLANGARGTVSAGGVFAREFAYSVSQIVDRFGIENCPKEIKRLYDQKGGALSTEFIVRHLIEPNGTPVAGVPSKFEYREFYWIKGSDNREFLEIKGFNECPFVAPRWDLSGNDAYGRSPAMDALGDIKQLQQEQRRKAEAIDKMVRPPMVADIQLKNAPASLIPGGITYVAGNTGIGFKPAYEVQPRIQELMLDIQECQARIKNIFFNDLFMMISQLQTVRSATEIDARREEKLIMLGPVLERFENEALDPIINRVFGIMMRGGLLPPPPEEIQGQEIQVQYVSMLAEAQRAASSAGIERLVAFAGNLAAVDPTVLDSLDLVEAVNEYSSVMGVPPKLVRSREQIAELQKARQQEKQMAEAMQVGMAGVQGAKVLSETEVGGGNNALQQMIGGLS
jgi:hypothetical protein